MADLFIQTASDAYHDSAAMEHINRFTPDGVGMDGTPLQDPAMGTSHPNDQHSGQQHEDRSQGGHDRSVEDEYEGANDTVERDQHPYYDPSDDVEPLRTNNDTEITDRDPWKCICGKIGRDDSDMRAHAYCEACCTWQHRGCLALSYLDESKGGKHHHCYRCVSYDDPQYADLLAARARGERPWERNMMVHEVLAELNGKNVDCFWTLYSRLNQENVQAMAQGRNLRGEKKGKFGAAYRSEVERTTRVLLSRLGLAEMVALHQNMQTAAGNRSQLYNLLRAEADRLRPGWTGCEQELGVLAELFGWVPKTGKSSSK
ncbi:hypothetical protein LTR85_006311 [Meristemomyces frigidus]|nr:hypothetical protein LTR85_006311 [Meristemomyces frigidus]